MIAPALALFVTCKTIVQLFDGGAKVKAPPLTHFWRLPFASSRVVVPDEIVERSWTVAAKPAVKTSAVSAFRMSLSAASKAVDA